MQSTCKITVRNVIFVQSADSFFCQSPAMILSHDCPAKLVRNPCTTVELAYSYSSCGGIEIWLFSYRKQLTVCRPPFNGIRASLKETVVWSGQSTSVAIDTNPLTRDALCRLERHGERASDEPSPPRMRISANTPSNNTSAITFVVRCHLRRVASNAV